MDKITALPTLHTGTKFNPTIFTSERIESLSQANYVARMLRQRGFKVLAEDPFPNDGGRPIIQVDSNNHEALRWVDMVADCITTNANANRRCAVIETVRVVWFTNTRAS